MGRIKEQMLLEQEQEYELDLSYAEWLRDNTQESTELDINRMAKEYMEPYNLENFYLYVFSVNNVEYMPKVV